MIILSPSSQCNAYLLFTPPHVITNAWLENLSLSLTPINTCECGENISNTWLENISISHPNQDRPVLLLHGERSARVAIACVSSRRPGTMAMLILGRGSNNQNGNLRWHLPWRGGGLECHIPILKNDFFKKPFRIIPWLWKRVLHLVWALYYVYNI